MPALHLEHETPLQLEFDNSRFIPWVFLLFGGPLAVLMPGVVEGGGAGRYAVGGGMAFFALIGVVGVLYRYRLTIDLSSRTYRGLRGFWPSPRRMAGSLNDMPGVVLERHWITSEGTDGEKQRRVTWTLSFDFGDSDKVGFFATRIESQAYSKLEHFSKLLRLPAIDRTSEEERRREPENLDRSMAQAGWSNEDSAAAPTAPPGAGRIDWDPSSGTGCITLPPLGLSMRRVASLVLGFGATLVDAAVTLAQLGLVEIPVEIRGGGWIVAAFFPLFGLGTSFQTLGQIRNRRVIREELDGLLIYRTTLLGGRRARRSLAKREIEEVVAQQVADDYTRRLRARMRLQPEEMALRTDAGIVRVGETLTAEEQRWLVQALKHLVGR